MDEADPPASPATRTSRRGFLKISGAALAGAAAGGVAGAAITASVIARDERFEADTEYAALAPRHQPGFDHVVVLMGENRSFDNLLGYLYTKDDLPAGAVFEGLAFGDHGNTAPDGTRIPAHVYSGPTDLIMGYPDPDPGEEYPHVNTQLFGTFDPPENAQLPAAAMKPPFNAPKPGAKATMDGFVADYASHVGKLSGGSTASAEELSRVMGSFSPDMLPVVSTLAREFAVFDHWYAGVPSQTFCNRSFFHASTSHGFVTNHFNGGFEKWLNAEPSPTIFNRLEEAGVSWRIYFDKLQLVSFTGFLHAPVLEKYWKTSRFGTMEDFYADAAAGKLPAYAFIEPRMIYNHNDFHPPFGTLKQSSVDGTTFIDSAQSDVRAGDALVHDVYTAIRRSASPQGSNAINTMLLITFDEHGGCYDHVAPPQATPPDDSGAGEMGFGFDRLGCRVPTIAVSAYTARNTIIHDEMHHGSVIATLNRLHGLEPLTARDAGANDLLSIVNLQKPRHPADWPTTTASFTPPNPEATPVHPAHANKDKPLTPPAQGVLGLLLAKSGLPASRMPKTFADAYELLDEEGKGLFGPR
ncbi:alkaline phosphatase family protein [Microbacterium sp.]|uniref:alkaline phosphatase family protein n=1 Tax=Microbacterium sp. TaxID=51671 RepID=UPI003A91C1A5